MAGWHEAKEEEEEEERTEQNTVEIQENRDTHGRRGSPPSLRELCVGSMPGASAKRKRVLGREQQVLLSLACVSWLQLSRASLGTIRHGILPNLAYGLIE